MKKYVVAHAGPAVALIVCAVGAWLVTLPDWKPPVDELIPFAFLGIVLGLGIVFGRTVGVFGSIIAAIVFAYSMYEPLGSMRVADQGDRSGLAWMLLAGITVSYLLLPTDGIGTSETKRLL